MLLVVVRPHVRYMLKVLAFAVLIGLFIVPVIMGAFGVIPALLLDVAWLGPLLLGLLLHFLSIRYELDTTALTIHSGPFTSHAREIAYEDVIDLRLVQGPFDWLLGIASLELVLADGQETLVGLRGASSLCHLIRARVRATNPAVPLDAFCVSRVAARLNDLDRRET